MNAVVLALELLAILLATIELIRTRGESLIAWGLLALAVALLRPIFW